MPPRGALCRAASSTLSATSCKKAVFSAAASSNDSGGTRRVLARPGAEALAMKAIPQLAATADCGVLETPDGADLPSLQFAPSMSRSPQERPQMRSYRNAKILRQAPITSGSQLPSRQTPKSYSLHKV